MTDADRPTLVWTAATFAAGVGTLSFGLLLLGELYFFTAPIAMLAAGWTVYYVVSHVPRKRFGAVTGAVLLLASWGWSMGALALVAGVCGLVS